MNEQTPFWMKGAKAETPYVGPSMSGKTHLLKRVVDALPVGPAVSQAEAEAVDCNGVVVATATVEVLPPEALACINVQGIAISTATQLKAEFRIAFGDAASVLTEAATVQVTDVDQTAEMSKAKALRLRLKAIRCDVENVRKTQKADSLLRGKAIDGAANALKGVIEPAEAWLLEQEQFAERADKLRRGQLHDQRLDALRPFVDVLIYCQGVAVEDLTPEAFDAFLEGAKMQAQVRAETERSEAEALRVQEAARVQRELDNETERLRLKAENDRLQAEQATKDAAAAVERKAAADKQAAVDAENKRLRDEAEKTKKEEADRLAEVERQRLAKVAADKAEAARLAEIERKAASAPDMEKVLAFVAAVRAVPIPQMTSEAGSKFIYTMDYRLKLFADGIIESAKANM